MTPAADWHGPEDVALTRELEALLAVDAPPALVARVRQRVASEPAPAAWPWSRTAVATGFAALAATLLLFSMIPRERDRVPEPVTAAGRDIALAPPLASHTPAAVASAVPPRPRPVVDAPAVGIDPAPVDALPAVLIDRGERAALLRLVRGDARERIDLVPSANVLVAFGASLPIDEVRIASLAEVAPLAVESLPVPVRQEGVRQ